MIRQALAHARKNGKEATLEIMRAALTRAEALGPEGARWAGFLREDIKVIETWVYDDPKTWVYPQAGSPGMKPWVGWMFGLVGFEVLANFFAKSWGDRGGAWRFWVASLLYFTCNASWLYALRAGVGLARGATLFVVLATLFTYSMGVFVFGERPTRVQLVGSVLALVAVVLLLFGEEST